MKELIISQIAPIVATAITAMLVIVIKQISVASISLLVTKKKETEQNIEAAGYKSKVDQALEVWRIVDDKFRLTQNAIDIFGSKEKLFEQILLKRIPGLTQKNIDDLRETISGLVNQGRKEITLDDTAQQLASLQEAKAKLEAENTNLKAAIYQLNSSVQTVATNIQQVTA